LQNVSKFLPDSFLNIEIKESVQELKKLIHNQRQGRQQERISALYLLKSHQAETSLQVANLIGQDYSTIKRWLKNYRQGGIAQLLKIKHGGGRSLSIPTSVLKALEQRLEEPQGFDSYQAIQV
jgi:transposase